MVTQSIIRYASGVDSFVGQACGHGTGLVIDRVMEVAKFKDVKNRAAMLELVAWRGFRVQDSKCSESGR